MKLESLVTAPTFQNKTIWKKVTTMIDLGVPSNTELLMIRKLFVYTSLILLFALVAISQKDAAFAQSFSDNNVQYQQQSAPRSRQNRSGQKVIIQRLSPNRARQTGRPVYRKRFVKKYTIQRQPRDVSRQVRQIYNQKNSRLHLAKQQAKARSRQATLDRIRTILSTISSGLLILGCILGGPVMLWGFMQLAVGHEDGIFKVLFGLLGVGGGLATPHLMNMLLDFALENGMF